MTGNRSEADVALLPPAGGDMTKSRETDEQLLERAMRTTGIDRAGAEQALDSGGRLADTLIEAVAKAGPARVEGSCRMCGYNPDAPVRARWEFVIPLETLSLNAQKRSGNAKWQHVRYRKERDAWQWAVKVARVNNRITPATGRRRVTLTRLYAGRQREMDDDNSRGGMKPVRDSLVLEGLLLDDSREQAEFHYLQERAPDGVSALRVLIEELK